MRRLFTFGCSYTGYAWPTWADLLGMDFDESHNWALSGIGNRAIAERVSEANVRHNFGPDDVIIVQWSSHLRNDWFHLSSLPERLGTWKTAGSIFNYINEKLYDRKWIETFFCEPAYLMHTLNNIALTQGLLESTGCKWYMTSIGDVRNMGADLRDNDGIGEQTGFINPYEAQQNLIAWKKIPELMIYNNKIWEQHADHWLEPMEESAKRTPELTFVFDDTVTPGKTFKDTHPTTRQHLMWLEQELKDKLQISEKTITLAHTVADAVDAAQQKFRFNKHTFELMLAKRMFFSEELETLRWPYRYEGF